MKSGKTLKKPVNHNGKSHIFRFAENTTKSEIVQQFVFYLHFNGDLSKDIWERRLWF